VIRLGLIGSGIQASRSPAMHEAAARARGAPCEYKLFDFEALGVDVDGLPDVVAMLERQGYRAQRHPLQASRAAALDRPVR
jgi:shikimate dehydrogenase